MWRISEFSTLMIECYTYDMGAGEAGDKDSIISLFEPMPPEALEPNPDLPQNTPLSPEERREALNWLLSPEGGGVSVRLRKPYDNPQIHDQLIENLLLNSWFIPDQALGNRIPLQAGSGHKVGSSTIPLTLTEDTPKRIDVVIKPFHVKYSKADQELTRLAEARNRGISAVEPFGVLEVSDQKGHDIYTITVLKKGIVPLQKIDFEHLTTGEKFTQLKHFLTSLGRFVASMHNKGLVHQDLHLGNIAADLTQESPDEFVIFDLEKSTIMAHDKLGAKNKTSLAQSEETMRKFREFERLAIKDVVDLAAEIGARNTHIPYDAILHYFVIKYHNARTPSHGRLSDQEFMAAFDARYKKTVDKIKKMIEWQRNRLAEEITPLRSS